MIFMTITIDVILYSVHELYDAVFKNRVCVWMKLLKARRISSKHRLLRSCSASLTLEVLFMVMWNTRKGLEKENF